METIDKIYLECLDKSCGCQQYATIMSALPQHKTDMIFRVENLDRYDDRDVIVTNLLDMYERMSAFAKKHLSNPFVLDGVQSVSARDAILREIISNRIALQRQFQLEDLLSQVQQE